MSSTIDGLKIFMKAMADSKPWLYDPLALRLPWSETEYDLAEHGGGEKLCFAMMWDDGYVKPHPPYKRAMEKTKKALEAAGHTGEALFPLRRKGIRLTPPLRSRRLGSIPNRARLQDYQRRLQRGWRRGH